MTFVIFLVLLFVIPFEDRANDLGNSENLPVANVVEICQGVQWINNMDELWGPWNGNERSRRCFIPIKTPYVHHPRGEKPIIFIGPVYLKEVQNGGSLYLIGKSKDKMYVFGASV